MAGPIATTELVELKASLMPDEVFDVFNQLIASNWDGKYSIFSLAIVINGLEGKGFSKKSIFEQHLLDVEDIYVAKGWNFVAPKTGFNDPKSAHYYVCLRDGFSLFSGNEDLISR